MSLREDTYARGRTVLTLTACPACGYDFDAHERRRTHLSTHAPEDFGLAPLGEIPTDRTAPTFGGEQVDA